MSLDIIEKIKIFENKLITKYKNQVNQGVLIFAAGVHRAYGNSKKLKNIMKDYTENIKSI